MDLYIRIYFALLWNSIVSYLICCATYPPGLLMTWMLHCTLVGQHISIQIFKFMKEYQIVKPV